MARRDVFVEMVNQVPSDIRPLVPGFLDRREKEADDLRDLLEMTDYKAIQDAGHKLKGTGSGYGFDVISDIGREIEFAARERNFESLKHTIERLAEVTRRLKKAIRDQQQAR